MSEPTTRLRCPKGCEYPTGESLKLVQRRGGMRRLTAEERETLVIKTVPPGGYCDDLPKASIPNWLARGTIEEVTLVLGTLGVKAAVEHVEESDADQLDALEAEELGASKPRKTVLAAISARRDEETGGA